MNQLLVVCRKLISLLCVNQIILVLVHLINVGLRSPTIQSNVMLSTGGSLYRNAALKTMQEWPEHMV